MDVCAENVVRRFLAQATYTGVFLDSESHARLLRWWNGVVKVPLHSTLYAHHMTLMFSPTPEQIEALPLGQKAYLKVVGWAADEKGQAVLVTSKSVRSDNAHPHVTMACAPDTAPVYSNELLSHGVTRVNGPTLTGIIEAR